MEHNSLAVSSGPDEGRCVLTRHGGVSLFNVYTPNGGERPSRPRLPIKMSFLRGLRAAMDAEWGRGQTVVLVGDLNIAHGKSDVYPSSDSAEAYHGYSAEEIEWMDQLIGPARDFISSRSLQQSASSDANASCAMSPANHVSLSHSSACTNSRQLSDIDCRHGLESCPRQRTWPLEMSSPPPLVPLLAPTPATAASLSLSLPAQGPACKAARREQTTTTQIGSRLESLYCDVFQHTSPPITLEEWTRGAGTFTCFDQRRAHRFTNKGVRIDYIICSVNHERGAGAVQMDRSPRGTTGWGAVLAHCAVLNTPASWSDHLPVRAHFRGGHFETMRASSERRPWPTPTQEKATGGQHRRQPGDGLVTPTQFGPIISAEKFLRDQRKVLDPNAGNASLLSFFSKKTA